MTASTTPSPLARIAGALTVLLGMLALAGWSLDIPALKSVLRGAVEMKANTAVALVLAGAALFISDGRAAPPLQGMARVMALIVAALGLVTLSQYVFGWHLRIDELLFRDTANAYNAIPGRMSPYSALAFGAIGLALVVVPSARLRPVVWLMAALVALVGVVSLLGYVWNASELVTDNLVPPVAVHTALAFTSLGIGTLLASRARHARIEASAPTRASIEIKVAGGFVAAFLLLAVGGGITYRSSAEFAQSAQSVARTQELRARLGELYAGVSNAESAARTYVLTGTQRYKDDYARFGDGSRHDAEVLGRLVSDPSQQALLERLNALVAQRLTALEQTIAVHGDQGYEAARARVATEGGTRIMDALRALAREMDDAEAARLVQREARANGDRQNLLVFLLLTLACAAGVFGFLLHSIRREMLARAGADACIRQLNANLERRVEERTASLEENQRRFVDLFEFAPDALVMTNREGAIVQVNRQAEALFGWTRADLLGQPVELLMPADARAGHVGLRRRFLESAVPRAMGAGQRNLRGLRKDGTTFFIDISLSPLQAGGNPMVVAAVRDVTERNRAEDEIRANNAGLERRVAERTTELVQAREAAEDANRAKSVFLATMSHEIRTPMNGVIGMVEVLSKSRLPEHQADAVRTIRASAFSLLGIIDDILDFSKIEAGRLELERAPVALPELIESVCDTLLPVANDKDVDLSLFIAPKVPAQVWSDATRLRQVLFNLAGNAIKFSAGRPQRRGRVSIRVDVAGGEAAQLVLRCDDNGIGIAPERLAHLFSSFTQAEASTTRRFGGTGLGLAICKRLVTLMNGEIEVQSTLGEGSTFSVTLPVEAVHGGTGRPAPDLAGLDCIVVGSDVNADDLRVYLEHAGARVHLTASLDAAVQRVTGLGRPVVIQNTPRDGPSPDVLRAAFGATAEVRHLLIARGQRRRPRMAADGVALDGDGLRRQALLRAVAVAAGRASPDVRHESDGQALAGEQAGPPAIAQARAQGRLILVAEDDEVNQKVILRQLEVLGYAAEIAADGADALRLWRAGNYALLLTDLHMPDMDGYTLAEAIRRDEAQRGDASQRHMPILALTANALRGEAIRAQAAGMDEYLTKPLQLHLLKAALGEWLPRGPADRMPAELPEEPRGLQAAPALDVAVLKGLVGDDPQVVSEFLEDYRASAGRLATELRAARAADDIRQIGAIAHKLKSSSRSVGALVMGDLCAELENACLSGTREGIPHRMLQFEVALHAVDTQIDLLTTVGSAR